MAVQKNFVVKNGLEVKSNLILANGDSNTVGIATSVTRYTLHVNGGIGATSLQLEGGIGTIPQLRSTNIETVQLSASGIVTAGSLRIGSTQVVSSGRELQNIASLDATTIATIESAISNPPNNFTDIQVAGISTFTNGPVLVGGASSTGTSGQVLQVAGINSSVYIGGNVGVGSTNPTTKLWVEGTTTTQDLNVIDELTTNIVNANVVNVDELFAVTGIVTTISGTNLNYSGIGTIGSLTATSASVSGVSSLGRVQIASGIVTSAAGYVGMVTYYGDGRKLFGYSGTGIATVTGVVGYGITTFEFRGPGVSTITADSVSGIATINISGGNVSIAVTNVAPLDPNEGNLWFNTDLGRTFIYYDDSDGGSQWVDAAPFNIGFITPVSIGLSAGRLQAPSLYFTADPDTGIYSPNLGSFALVADATQPLTVANSRVGIGSTLPKSGLVLDVNGNVAVSGVTTITNSSGTVRAGGGTTALIVEGNARITGILTIGTGSVTIDGVNNSIDVNKIVGVSTAGITTIYSRSLNDGPFSGFRNRIINGDMSISQRSGEIGTGNDLTEYNYGVGTGYVLDRWQGATTVANNLAIGKSTTAPSGYTYSLRARAQTGSAIGVSSYFSVIQSIEGLNVADLAFGTAAAKTVSVSFWVRCSIAGTHSGSLRNSANDRSYPFTYNINSTDTWEYKSVTIPGDTSGTWLKNFNVGIQLVFDLGSGSNFRGTAGSWSGNNYVGVTGAVSPMATSGATWFLTGVQFEEGPTSTPFEVRGYANELRLCQRYYVHETLLFLQGYIGSATILGVSGHLPVAMRINPILVETSAFNSNTTVTTLTVSNRQNVFATAAGLVIGPATLSSFFTASAEL